jgi:hypothetical protein
MSQYQYFKSGIIKIDPNNTKNKPIKLTQVITNRFIDFIFVNCCLISNIKSVKLLKKTCLQVEIFKCTLSKVLHNLYRHYTKIKGADNQG